MTSTALVGSTGLVGSHILSTLLALPTINAVHALARREPKTKDAKLHPLITTETSEWATQLSSISPPPGIFYSALGTTRGQAGSVEAQRKIDYDLNLSLATAAKNSGVKVYVLISTGGASATSRFAYPKMKGELEESVKVLDFEHTVIVKPGLIVGDREDFRGPELILRKIAGLAGKVGLKDGWAQDADVIAKAAVSAGIKALEGGDIPKVWEIGQADVVRLGRTEWKA